MEYKCPCCGYYTFKERPDGEFDICPVCFWEDDPLAYDDEDEECSCNHVSLKQARENFKKYGACVKDMVLHTRKPIADEFEGID